MNIVFRPCYLFLLWNVVLKCLALCLITIIAAYFPHLYACLTCSSVHASSLHPLLAHHHLCYVDVYCVFYLFLLYATFLCDSILDYLCTYFCLIVFFIPFLSFWLFTICQYPQCCVLNWMFLLWYTRYLVLKLVSSINVLVLLIDIICILHIMSEKEKSYLARYCCNLSGGVALIVWFTMNRMCAKNKNICMWREQAIIEWSRRSDLGEWPVIMLVNLVNSWLCLLTVTTRVILLGDLYCCLLPRCEALRTWHALGISDRNSIIQQPVNAGSRRIGLKTARPGVDYSSH